MNKKHNLFLDLEGVIIDDWYSGIPLWENLAGIKEWIRRHKPNKVFIFSAAVWNDKDKQKAIKHLVPFIEIEIGQMIDGVISMEEATNGLKEKIGFFDSVTDALCSIGKDHLYNLWVRKFHKHECSTLIDDSFGTSMCTYIESDDMFRQTKVHIFDSVNLKYLK
jgi:hypothetical protein